MVKKTPKPQSDEKTVHMSFDAPLELRNAFKAKVASQGKTVKEVIISLLKEYVESKKQ